MSIAIRLKAFGAAAVLALASVTTAPTQARASDDELIRFLLGAAAVAVIVHSFTDRPRESRPRDTGRRYTGNVLPGHCLETLRVRGRHVDVYNARCLRQAGVTRLPGRCAETIPTNRGQRHIYREQCLLNAGFRPEARHWQEDRRHRPSRPHRAVLPAQCEITYRHRGDRMRGYDGACLSRSGLRSLPESCALRARQERGGHLTIYNARCLHDAGYRASRRH